MPPLGWRKNRQPAQSEPEPEPESEEGQSEIGQETGEEGEEDDDGAEESGQLEEESEERVNDQDKEREIWDSIREDHFEVFEQLPMTLQRQYLLLKELDQQNNGFLDDLRTTVHRYIALRRSIDAQIRAQREAQHAALSNIPITPNTREDRPDQADSMSIDVPPSASTDDMENVTPPPTTATITEASHATPPPTTAPSTAYPITPIRAIPPHLNLKGLEMRTPIRTPTPTSIPQDRIKVPETSREMLSHIAWLTEEVGRTANEKVHLAQAAHDTLERQIRVLGQSIKEQEMALSLGARPGTQLAPIILPDVIGPAPRWTRPTNDADDLDSDDEEVPDGDLYGTGPPAEEGVPTLGIVDENPDPTNGAAQPARGRTSRRKSVNKKSQENVAAEPSLKLKITLPPLDQQRYCYCDQISFGEMLACDNPDCKIEWHLTFAPQLAPYTQTDVLEGVLLLFLALMSLDQNLFTLIVTPHKDDPNVIDLVDPSGTIHYRKQRVAGQTYTAEVYDFTSESLLVTAAAPSVTSKTKSLILCNPTTTVELKFTGTLSFRWSFKWEEHEFEWKREECFLIRKPDPPVLVAITKEPAGRLKTQSIQILDYNLNRFDVDDRKGLEIVILTALLTFQDANEASHLKEEPPKGTGTTTPARGISPAGLLNSLTPSVLTPPLVPPPPPKPIPSGVDRIAEMQAARDEMNEVVVEDEGGIDDYAKYSWNLLQDDAMLFVIVRSQGQEQVQKVVQVVEEIKRLHHKAGEEDPLHQYVTMDAIEQKGPKRINLDDQKGKTPYKPPENIRIHLSKIPLPELQPKVKNPPRLPVVESSSSKGKDREKSKEKEKERAKEKEKARKKDGKKSKDVSPSASPTAPSPSSRLTKPISSHSRSASSPHIHSHQVHPHHPSPSPSQLNNPGLNVAPPPRSARSTPHYANMLNAPVGALQARPPPVPFSHSSYPQPQGPPIPPVSPIASAGSRPMSGFFNSLRRH
ncbi:hypothetical protein PQX77_015054 [Marasmius sp. AFHP31]|nr:hypothetical protein PQX77_015054 [Marasmius sp. AFHP31]